MFILQRYKYYILNQKKSEKKFHGIAKKNERTGERMLFIVVPRLGIMRKKCY